MGLGLGAGLPLSQVMLSKPAIMRGQSMPRIYRGGLLGGLLLRDMRVHYGYRKKPWTCTAIEKRKAAKRRNVARHKQRVRS
ncbi:hypothetical protein [Solimonas flava]|uniref:hypothetical protein n=1 Tax=Solimonas flava TaxID=415849 RepID=UPI0012B51A66|nr:hypothetical protein [Solimonas flava]